MAVIDWWNGPLTLVVIFFALCLLLLTWSIAGVVCRACHSSGTFFIVTHTHTHTVKQATLPVLGPHCCITSLKVYAALSLQNVRFCEWLFEVSQISTHFFSLHLFVMLCFQAFWCQFPTQVQPASGVDGMSFAYLWERSLLSLHLIIFVAHLG